MAVLQYRWRSTIVLSTFILVASGSSIAQNSAIHTEERSGVVEFDPAPFLRFKAKSAGPVRYLLPLEIPTNIRVNQDPGTEAQNETSIAVNPLDGANLVGGANDYRNGEVDAGYYYSYDGGQTWNDGTLPEPTFEAQGDPAITVDADGNFYYSYISFNRSDDKGGLFVAKSTDGGATWLPPVAVAIHLSPGEPFEDKEYVGADAVPGSPYLNNVYIAWTRFGPGTNIHFSRSTDGGASFSTPMPISDQSSVQGAVPVVGQNGVVYVAWLNRSQSLMKLDRSYDGGVTFGTDVTISSVNQIPSPLPPTAFRDNSFPSIGVDVSGGAYDGYLYVVWADNPSGSDDADIVFSRSTDGGDTWSTPIRLNDDVTTNDQFFPWLAVDFSGIIHIIWYDRRDDPADVLLDVYSTVSYDGGDTFIPNEKLTSASSDPYTNFGGGFIGDYNGVAAFGGGMYPLWTDTRLGDQDAFTAPTSSVFIVSPMLLDFGVVAPGDSLEKVLMFANVGLDTVTIDDIDAADPEFTVSDTQFVLMPDDTHYVDVMFKPILSGFVESSLTALTSEPTRPTLNVFLSAIAGIPGDVDGDGIINVLDVVRQIAIVLGRGEPPTEFEFWAADFNGDGKIDIFDIIATINVILEQSI